MRVVLQISEPWEMGEALNWPRITGTIVSEGGGSWLVEFDRPFDYAGEQYRFVVVSARHEGDRLADATSVTVPCNMIRTTAQRASSANPCDVSWWRGGHAITGSVTAEPN